MRSITLSLFCLLLLCAAASAQTSTMLSGTVTDASGALVPNATVVAESPATGAKRTATADAAGVYTIPQLTPGTYTLSVTAAGFTAATLEGVNVLVNVPTTLNVTLEVGAVAQSVDVSATATQVNTTDATLGNAFGTRPILQLPLEARNVVGLLALQPGVTFIGEGTDPRNGAVNGGKPDQANVTLDGVDVNDQQERYAFTSVLRVTLDSVQEFRVTTTNANADQGRSSGAQIALVTKSGTNQVHGSLYEFHRNTITTANSFLNNAAVPAVPRPKLIRNTFGAAVGGPVKKNRLFYFFNYEGRRDAKEGAVERVVPNETMRNGILRYERTNGSIGVLTPDNIRALDPLGIGVNPRVLEVLKSYPLPNTTSSGDGFNTGGYRFVAPLPLRWNTYIARFDYNPTDSGRHALFVRGNLQNDRDVSLPQFPGDQANSVNLENSKGLAAGYNVVFTPTLIGSFRYGFTRQGIENSGLQSASAVSFFGVDDRFGLTTPFRRFVPVHTISQDFTLTRGTHSLQFGSVQRLIDNRRDNWGNSFHSAQTRASRLANSGGDLDPADINTRNRDPFRNGITNLLGVISTITANYNYDLQGNIQPVGSPVNRNFQGREYELYVQDVWRVNRSLTVTAGLRWSLMPPIEEADGYQIAASPSLGAWFDQRGGFAQQGKPMNQVTPLEYIPIGKGGGPLYEFHKKNFAPRIALAYAPQFDSGWKKVLFGGPGKSSIRAGWGMYYDLIGQSLMRNSDNNSFGLQTQVQSAGSQYSFESAPRYQGVYSFPPNSLPSAPAPTFPIQAPFTFARGAGVDSQIKPPYTMNLTFSFGRDLGGGFYLEGSYVGRLSRRSLIQSDVATPANLVDPKSGMDYFTAARTLTQQARKAVPVNQVAPVAFWENLWPAAAGNGLTATQRIYERYQRREPDYTLAIEDFDRPDSRGACLPACSIFGPYAIYDRQFASFTAWRSIAGGSYHGMQWTLRKRYAAGVRFDVNYTWSKSIDLASSREREGSSNTGILANPWNPGLRKAVSDYDMTHQFNANWDVELPFGKGRRWMTANKVADAFFGGWMISGLWRATSGLPVSVSNGRFWPTNWQWQNNAIQVGTFPTPQTNKNAPAVQGAGGPNLFQDPRLVIDAYDFAYPGDIGQRNGIRGDGFFTIDTGVSKRFRLPLEQHSIQFRWETFNLTNTARFDARTASLSLGTRSTFGRYVDMLTAPRVMQFGLRYEF